MNNTLAINMDINKERELAKRYLLETKDNIFLTGRAGSGKTTLIKEIIEETDKNTVVVAPTGVAAINAGGVTIHSFFQLPPSTFVPSDEMVNMNRYTNRRALKEHLKMSGEKRNLIQEMNLLVIDEISMVRADLLDAIDFTLRYIRKSIQPFGNVQVVMTGDLYQLPPVVREDEWAPLKGFYKSPYFFDAVVWKHCKMVPIELQKVYRQKNMEFLHMLNNFRDGQTTEADLTLLNTRYTPEFKNPDGTIILTTHNRKANRINTDQLSAISNKKMKFSAKVDGNFNESAYPCDKDMILKIGAQVMFIRNDRDNRYYNGKLAEVVDYDKKDDLLQVKMQSSSELFWIEKVEWSNSRYRVNEETEEIEQETLGSFTQFPLRLAWAVTVHKSQGLTLESVVLDLENSFASGQTYVALSRCTTLDGLYLTTKVQERNVIIDHRVRRFYQGFPELSLIEDRLDRAIQEYALYKMQNTFRLYGILASYEKWLTYLDRSKLPDRENYLNIVEGTQDKVLKLQSTASDFQNHLGQWITESETNPERIPYIVERSEKAIGYFCGFLFEKVIQPLHEHVDDIQHLAKVKKYLQLGLTTYDKIWKKIENLYALKLYGQTIYTQPEQYKKADLPDWKSARLQTKKKKGATFDITLAFFKEGLNFKEIAEKRSLVPSTIESHMTRWLKSGDVKIHELLTDDRFDQLKKAIEATTFEGTKELKDNMGVDCSYAELNWMMFHLGLKD